MPVCLKTGLPRRFARSSHARECTDRHFDVQGLLIVETDHPAVAMRAAALVGGSEPLEQQYAHPATRQYVGRRDTDYPSADYDRVVTPRWMSHDNPRVARSRVSCTSNSWERGRSGGWSPAMGLQEGLQFKIIQGLAAAALYLYVGFPRGKSIPGFRKDQSDLYARFEGLEKNRAAIRPVYLVAAGRGGRFHGGDINGGHGIFEFKDPQSIVP